MKVIEKVNNPVSSVAMSTSPRVGIAGYGLAGRVFHAQLLKGCGFEVVGIHTTNPERIAQAQTDFPMATVVSTYSQLLTLGLDLVVIASGNIVHAEQAIAAMMAGIPVVVDKPMGLNLLQTKEIFQVSESTGAAAAVFFNRKWDSDALTVKKILAEGTLGKVFRLDSRFERYRPDVNAQSWREQLSPEEGGGNLLDLQTHLVSLALDWFGAATVGYSAVRSIRASVDDDVVVVLNHDSGVDSYLSGSAIVGAPGPRIRLMGDAGALVIDELDPQEGLLRAGRYPLDGRWAQETRSAAFLHRGGEVTEYPAESGNYPHFYLAVKSALIEGTPWPTSKQEALAVAAIIDQAREISVRK